MPEKFLTRYTTIVTSGARAVEAFEVDGLELLAIPQLAYDVPGANADMNGGDSGTELLLLRREQDGYELYQTLSAPGGEDAEFFRIGQRAFLAVASIRAGSGPYRFATDSRIFAWNGRAFEPFQSIPSFAAKQWRHFSIDGRDFLALAQGVVLPGQEQENQPSRIYEWDGEKFAAFQDVESQWGYNWHAFELDGRQFLAYADHLSPSMLYRWDGTGFAPHQQLAANGGRAFAHFAADGRTYLLVARLQGDSQLLRWDGAEFVEHQVLADPGAREFAVIEGADDLYVLRINFVLGTPADPVTALDSELYRWDGARIEVVERFATTGATDAAVIPDPDGALVAVSNSLSAEVRFAAQTAIYRFHG